VRWNLHNQNYVPVGRMSFIARFTVFIVREIPRALIDLKKQSKTLFPQHSCMVLSIGMLLQVVGNQIAKGW